MERRQLPLYAGWQPPAQRVAGWRQRALDHGPEGLAVMGRLREIDCEVQCSLMTRKRLTGLALPSDSEQELEIEDEPVLVRWLSCTTHSQGTSIPIWYIKRHTTILCIKRKLTVSKSQPNQAYSLKLTDRPVDHC